MNSKEAARYNRWISGAGCKYFACTGGDLHVEIVSDLIATVSKFYKMEDAKIKINVDDNGQHIFVESSNERGTQLVCDLACQMTRRMETDFVHLCREAAE